MITVKADNAALKTLQNRLEQLDPKNQKFAVAVALTRSAKLAQEAIRQAMVSNFDRPNPYTLNSTFVQTASKSNLQAAVKIKDLVTKGKASGKNQPNRFLNPQVYSGMRPTKGIERKLAGIDSAMVGKLITPVLKNLPLDSYGNPTRGIYNKVIAGMAPMKGKAPLSPKGRALKTIYVVKKTGIYEVVRDFVRSGRGKTRKVTTKTTSFKRLFNIVNKANYKQRLDFFGIAEKTVQKNFQDELVKSIKLAMDTAR
jgi:hypothetical protein